MEAEMSHVEITLKSGATVHADVSEWGTTRNRVTNVVTGYSWTNEGPRRLSDLRVEEVAVVVFVDDDASPSGDKP
jgi:hypothetical protein